MAETQSLKPIDIKQTAAVYTAYMNLSLATVNDHVVKMSIMTEPYFLHLHPNSDETFLVVEGSLLIDLEDNTIEVLPNQLYTIPANVKHRTRPAGNRSVNLTFEKSDMITIKTE